MNSRKEPQAPKTELVKSYSSHFSVPQVLPGSPSENEYQFAECQKKPGNKTRLQH